MKLSKKDIITYWNSESLKSMRIIPGSKSIPKFALGKKVKIVTDEPDLGRWTWMDDIRKERKGSVGRIIGRDYIGDSKGYSPFTYDILFDDGAKITFVEEHLEKRKERLVKMQLNKEELDMLISGIRMQLDECEGKRTHCDKDIRNLFQQKAKKLYQLWEKLQNTPIKE